MENHEEVLSGSPITLRDSICVCFYFSFPFGLLWLTFQNPSLENICYNTIRLVTTSNLYQCIFPVFHVPGIRSMNLQKIGQNCIAIVCDSFGL